ncbi:MAG: NADH-quinone oxidoreductase subunit J [Deltaproteobacteria bacterium]|nr:NADH-quinone oxidoreductase subunit J [Deltaproteobacteria bacterium]
MDLFTFIILAILLVGSAMAVVLHPSPVYSALSLVVMMSLLAVYFLFLNAHVVGALQIIVYAGAVMVLFLFVIMLLNLQTESRENQQSEMKTSATILCLVMVAELAFFLGKGGGKLELQTSQQELPAGFGTMQALSERLFTDFVLPFEITSVLLLVAAVGAVVLARRQA